MKTDLISRSELFNKLATVPIKAESVETTMEIFNIINSMQTESVDIAESAFEQICDEYCKFPYIAASQDELERICDNCPLDNIASAWIESGSDLISRTEAIKAIDKQWLPGLNVPICKEIRKSIVQIISALPSAEQVTSKLKNPCNPLLTEDLKECKEKRSKLEPLPSASVEMSEWIPIKYHEITESEREENGYSKDWVYYLDCEMPQDGQEILVQVKNGEIRWDVCYEDDGFSLDSGWDWKDDIVAWMPLPKPYEGSESDE